MTYLLDTNVVSELRRRRPEPNVVSWYADVDSADLFLSVLVVGEITQGIERLRRRNDAAQADALEAWLVALKTDFAERVLPITTAVAERWGRLSAEQPLPPVDGMLAATALENGLTLVTRDTAAVAGTGAALLDPWEET